MNDVDNLLSPTMVVTNKQGEVILAMKKKGEKYGCLYYVFQLRLDRVPPEDLLKVQAMWDTIKMVSARMGIPLHDVEEIKSKVDAELKKKPNFKEGDITILVFDHATGTIRNLVVGVTRALNHNP
jgi:hypothetical protein